MTILMCEVVAGPRLLRHAPGHSRVTESRHQAALGGPGRTPRSGNLSSGGHLRSRRDTSGHATKTVRDREAPGSNPGPPTILYSESAISGSLWGQRHTAGSQFPTEHPNRGGVNGVVVGQGEIAGQ